MPARNASIADTTQADAAATSKQTVLVFGPNLSSKGQRLGNLHVHAPTCGDCKRYGRGKPMGGDPPSQAFTVEARYRRDVVLDIYTDHGATEDDWQDYDDLYVAPCVTFEELPVEAPPAPIDARAIVAEQIKEARAELTTKLRDHEKMVAKYDKEVAKAGRALDKARTNDDAPMTDKERQAWIDVERANDRYLSAYDAATRVRRALAKLDDEAHIERRVAEIERTMRTTRNGGTKVANAGSSTTRRSGGGTRGTKTETPKATVERIVKLIEEGKGVTAVAKILAEENVAAPTKAGWYGRAVYNIYVKATGKSVGEARKSKPLASRAVKNRPAAAVRRLTKTGTKKATAAKKTAAKKSTSKKATARKSVQVTPHPKPSAKTAAAKRGTSRSSSRSAKKTGRRK